MRLKLPVCDRRKKFHEYPGHHSLEVEENPIEKHHHYGLYLSLQQQR